MLAFYYDKTFEGLLSALFDAYDRRAFPDFLLLEGEQEPLFTEQVHHVNTDEIKYTRVWKGLQKRLPYNVLNMLLYVWLSEECGSDALLIRYLKKVFDDPHFSPTHFADSDILHVKQLAEKVAKEKLYLIQFVRFQKAIDGTFFAPVAPQYNALPLALPYFTDRFADQKWLIYDLRRKYGYYYDLHKPIEVTLPAEDMIYEGKLNEKIMAEDEEQFQKLWKTYFKAMPIKERLNPKLQKQNMPKRFWKFLTEKQ